MDTDIIQQGVTVLLGLHALALAIVNITPTPKDNQAFAKFYKVVELAAGIVTAAAKEQNKDDID